MKQDLLYHGRQGSKDEEEDLTESGVLREERRWAKGGCKG